MACIGMAIDDDMRGSRGLLALAGLRRYTTLPLDLVHYRAYKYILGCYVSPRSPVQMGFLNIKLATGSAVCCLATKRLKENMTQGFRHVTYF